MIKKELYRSFLLLLTRIIRGFIIPNLFSPIVYDSIVQVFALSRFSLIFDFGYREFAITSKNSRFYLKKLVLISIISGLILAIFSISLMHALKISFFLIPFFFVFYKVSSKPYCKVPVLFSCQLGILSTFCKLRLDYLFQQLN